MSTQKKFFKFFAWIFFAFLATLMLSFGLDPTSMFQENKNYAAKVNGEVIPIQAYSRRHDQLRQLYQQQFKDAFAQLAGQLNLKQQAMDAVITEHLLNTLTNEIGLTADRGHIEQRILELPYFGGEYTEQKYQSFLLQTGLTGGQVERQVKNELIRKQITDMFKHASNITDAELQAVYSDENTKIKLNYVEVTPDKFKGKVDLANEEKLKEFFEGRKNLYQQPRQLSFSYVAFEPKKFEANVEVTEEDIAAAYQERISEFIVPREVRVRQIFIAKPEVEGKSEIPFLEEEEESATETKADDPVELARQRAIEILQELDDGADFAKLAQKKSEDQVTKSSGGDIGFSKLSDLSPDIGNAVKDLGEGEYSELVETDKAFYILQLAEDKPSREKPLDEVKAEVEKQLREGDAPLYAMEEAEIANELIQEQNKSLIEYFNDKPELSVVSSGKLVDFNTAEAGTGRRLFGEINKFNKGEKEVVDLGGTPYLVSIHDVKEAFVPELKVVKEKVLKDFEREQQKNLASEFADKLLEELKAEEKTSLATLAKKHSLKLQTSDESSKKSPSNSGPLAAFNIREKAFTLEELNQPMQEKFEFQRKYYLIELASKELPKEEDFKSQVDSLRSSEQLKASNRLMQALVADMRAKAEIQINEDLLRQG